MIRALCVQLFSSLSHWWERVSGAGWNGNAGVVHPLSLTLPRNLSEEQVVYAHLHINPSFCAERSAVAESMRHILIHRRMDSATSRGMTQEKLCRARRPVPGRKSVARRYISLSPKGERAQQNHKPRAAAAFRLWAICLLSGLCFSATAATGALEPSHATMTGKPVSASVQRRAGAQSPAPGKSTSSSEQTIELTLRDAVFLGLRGNRSIRSAYLDRIAEKFSLRVEEDRFNPKISLTGSYLSGRSQDGRANTSTLAPAITLLGKYGTQLSLSWNQQSSDAQHGDSTRSGGPTLSIIQPLLRGGGSSASAPLRLARLTEQANQLKLKTAVSDTVVQIIQAYYEVLRAQEQLKIAREGLERSRQLLDVNKAMIDAGRMAKFDAVQTEADSVTQELSVEETAHQLDAKRLDLLRLLALDSNTRITAVETPVAQRIDIGRAKALSTAFEQRPAYLAQLIASEQASISLAVARNEQLWDVSLVGSASQSRNNMSPEYGGNRAWQANVGVQVNIRLGDLSVKQAEVQAKVNVAHQDILLAEARQALELDVANAVRQLETCWRQYEIAQRALTLSQRKLEVEREKLQAGRSSNFQVLSFESDLRTAENASLNALIAYFNAQSALDNTLGTTLKSWEINLND